MTIARNIESVPANWSGGVVGAGHLSRGNSNHTTKLAPGEDSDPYHRLPPAQQNDGIHKRTHQLSNREVIWDMAGNVWQWVADDLTLGQNGWQEYTVTSHFPSGADSGNRLLFGPAGNYSSAQNIGQIYMWDAGCAVRGGFEIEGANAGVFAAHLNSYPSLANAGIGFRCALTLE